MKWMPIALILLLIALVACDLGADEERTPQAATQVPSDASPTPSLTAPQSDPSATAETPPPVSRSITLTVWTSTEIAPNTDIAGGSVLLEQLSAFDNDHSNVSLLVELKTIADQGGTLSYLRTGRSVAPAILPDVILLPSSQLSSAASQELIYPLDGLVAQEAIDDLFPAAREMVEVDEGIYGYPFALTGLQHLVYDRSVITETVSTDWNTLTAEQPGVFIYPAGGAAGAELTALFYHRLGGTFLDGNGQPGLQAEPLVDALELIQLGVAQGFVDPQSGATTSPEQAWQIFQESTARIVQTTASHYLSRRAENGGSQLDSDLRILPLPGPGGPLTPTVGAWVWAISTPDAERQEVAAELIDWLASSENLSAWTLQSYTLPARLSAFDMWPDDPYVTFLRRQLSSASPWPAGLNNTILTALSNATTGVILGLSTPAEAAQQAMTALSP